MLDNTFNIENILNNVDLCVFIKDKLSRFIYCNETFAKRANLDSPTVALGKSDFNLCWRENAELYQHGDSFTLQGGIWTNVVEPQIINGKIYNVLVTKNLIFIDNHPYIFGSFQDVSDLQVVQKNGHFDPTKKRFCLNETFNHHYLTIQEYKVFRYVLKGFTSKHIATILQLSPKTIESYIEKIKFKLKCKTKNDIIVTAILNGLTFILSEPFQI